MTPLERWIAEGTKFAGWTAWEADSRPYLKQALRMLAVARVALESERKRTRGHHNPYLKGSHEMYLDWQREHDAQCVLCAALRRLDEIAEGK